MWWFTSMMCLLLPFLSLHRFELFLFFITIILLSKKRDHRLAIKGWVADQAETKSRGVTFSLPLLA